MAELPSPTKVVGEYMSTYENYYKLVDPKNEGKILAPEAAKFLKKSLLSDKVLSEIWDIADPNSRGYLDKPGMFVALKLCALAQQGLSLNKSDIYLNVPPPKMEDASSSWWTVSSSERKKYENLFLSLEPINGYIPGNRVKGVLMDSKLSLETLGKIWDLADMDNDGRLNLYEFTIAMHLVYVALEKKIVPDFLPAELAESSKINASNNSLNLHMISSANQRSFESTSAFHDDEWVVSREDQLVADNLFSQTDKDMDGFVSGGEIKDIFIKTGLPQTVLAHIWNLCDTSCSGKLNNEQFALAMWLIKQTLNGSELPNTLPNKMIPPSFKRKNRGNIENNNICPYVNPELNMIDSEISEIIREKHLIEQDISQKEADIQIQTGKIKSLQSELDSLMETFRQLGYQKEEAQKGLNDLKSHVEDLRQQASDQEVTLQTEEEELRSRRKELKTLKITEKNLEFHKFECNSELNYLYKELQNKQLKISQIKANMTHLEEQQHQIVDATAQCDAALATGNAMIIPKSSLAFKAKLDEAMFTCHISSATSKIPVKLRKDALFKNNLKNERSAKDQKDAFIKNDLKNERSVKDHKDALMKNDSRREKSVKSSKNDQIIKQNRDSFKTSFPFKTDNTDPFGDDPFASLPTSLQLDSPGPALPPKQSKIPPPRPAPRRQVQPPPIMPRSSVNRNRPPAVSPTFKTDTKDPFGDDPFVSKSVFDDDLRGALAFADFANFNNMVSKSITNDFHAKCKLDGDINYNPVANNTITDFEDDPFANYRYDDLFMISDPFAENSEDFKKIK